MPAALRRALDVLGVALVAAAVLHAASRALGLQWDFKTYLLAARAALQGLDPYDPAGLAAVAGRPVPFAWLYAPVALLPFAALSRLPIPDALVLWMALKVAALAATIVAWRRAFVPEAPWTAVALVAVFGGDGSALADLRTGNLGILEAALLSFAFAAWLGGRARTFAALVVAVAVFKLVPILYLGLLLVPGPGRAARPRVALAAFAAFVALVAGPLVVAGPGRGGGFLRNVPAGIPVGEANPTLFALIETGARELPGLAGLGGAGVAIVWAGLALAVVALSARALLRHARSADRRRLPAALVLVETLLSPRLMQYGFVRAGLPLLFWSPTGPRADPAAADGRPGAGAALAWAALVSLPGILRWAKHPITGGPWLAYAPLAFLVVAFAVALRARDEAA